MRRMISTAATLAAVPMFLGPTMFSPAQASPAQAAPREAADVRFINDFTGGVMKPYNANTSADTKVDTDSSPGWANNGTDWEIERVGDTHTIRNLKADMCLQPENGVAKAGKLVVIRPCNGRSEQRWFLVEGEYDPRLTQIVPAKQPGLAIGLKDNITEGWSYVQLTYRNGNATNWNVDQP